MRSAKTKTHLFLTILILLTAAGGAGAYLAVIKLTPDKPETASVNTTRFYVQNESQIIFGKPAIYRILLENQEGISIDYKLKVRLAGEEVYSKNIPLTGNGTFNQTITITPETAGEYLKLEFQVLKNNETYRTRVFQVSPVIDRSQAQNMTITPPLLQNGDMEKDTGWKFTGKDFSGNYTKSEWSSGNRSYLISAVKGMKQNASAMIETNYSNNRSGFASLSFDLKSDNASYYLQALIDSEVVWENASGKDWKRIKVPVYLKTAGRIELRVLVMNETRTGVRVWWDRVGFEKYSSPAVENVTKVKKEEPQYKMVKNGSSITYLFFSGEKLEIKIKNGTVQKGDAIYTATADGDKIIFLNETYERMIPGHLNQLYSVIFDSKGMKLKENNTIKLKNGYGLTLKNNSGLKFSIFNEKRTLRDILITDNSTKEYWKKIDEYKKQKVLEIDPVKINKSEIVLNITQYGDRKMFNIGAAYNEFQISNISDNMIIMKNTQPIRIEAGKQVSLINGKIKITV